VIALLEQVIALPEGEPLAGESEQLQLGRLDIAEQRNVGAGYRLLR